MTPAEEKEALELAERWCEIRMDESYGPQGKNLGTLARAVMALDLLYSEANQDKEAMSARIAQLEGMQPEAGALTEARRLLGEWLKRAEAHAPEINKFRGGYQPFLSRATREFLNDCRPQLSTPSEDK